MKNRNNKLIAGYNERLFTNRFRRILHMGRYEWIQRVLETTDMPCITVLELGCFDGKAINWLPKPPIRYLGLDANWEKGLDIASDIWRNFPHYEFRHCNHPEKMQIEKERFDISICLETLEHVPPEMVKPYLTELAKTTRGLLLISVPNEIGPVFLFKHLFKLALGNAEKYSPLEIFNQTLGRVDRVKRNQHKGFSWRLFKNLVEEDYEIVRIDGIPFSKLPLWLNFGIGIVAQPKQ